MQQYLIGVFQAYGYNPARVNRRQLHTTTVPVPVVHLTNLMISFPGYKSINNGCYDYLVQLHQYNVSHIDIMYEINGQIVRTPQDAQLMQDLLVDIAHNWEDINLALYRRLSFTYFTLEEFVECICYIAMQEEFNYPRPTFIGYKRPFYSYLEALYAAINGSTQMFNSALIRVKAPGPFVYLPGIPYILI